MKRLDVDYLTGRLSVCYAIDMVSLIHKVQGRSSSLYLAEGDLIEIEDENGEYKTVTIQAILGTIVREESEKHNKFHLGKSMYQERPARVQLNPKTTRSLEHSRKRYFMNELMHLVRLGGMSYEEAMETYFRWEADFED